VEQKKILVRPEVLMLTDINGDFECECGCGVFHQLFEYSNRFQCMTCEKIYVGIK